MLKNNKKNIYIIDTDSLAKLGKLQENIFDPIWEYVESMAAEGRLITSVKVIEEIERKFDRIRKWLTVINERYQIAYPILPDQVKRIGEIQEQWRYFVDHEYEDADPYLVTLAEWLMGREQKTLEDKDVEYYVVTEERIGSEHKNYDNPCEVTRIPDFCHVLGIKHTNFWGMVELEGWQWTR